MIFAEFIPRETRYNYSSINDKGERTRFAIYKGQWMTTSCDCGLDMLMFKILHNVLGECVCGKEYTFKLKKSA